MLCVCVCFCCFFLFHLFLFRGVVIALVLMCGLFGCDCFVCVRFKLFQCVFVVVSFVFVCF